MASLKVQRYTRTLTASAIRRGRNTVMGSVNFLQVATPLASAFNLTNVGWNQTWSVYLRGYY